MTIPVSLGERSYRILVTESYRQLPAALAALRLPREGWVVSHERLLRRYGASLLGPLRRAGWSIDTITVPESERSKSLAALQRLVGRLAQRSAMRTPVLLAFGGGVIGDLTGFAAAVFRRGVPYVQLPTTLLAQVDSAIGGKVGVDVPQAKNLLGAFYQPRLVCNNLSLLGSLPLRQRRSGLGEVIKYGLIADAPLFSSLEERLDQCLALEPRDVRMMVERSCRIKAQLVSTDERDSRGARAQLNFGHTLGHALETATGYGRWTHGEAIAIGMCAAARLGVLAGACAPSVYERVERLLSRAGLPTHARGVAPAAVWRAMRYDKKFIHGRMRWVLPIRIGAVTVTDAVPERLIRKAVSAHLA